MKARNEISHRDIEVPSVDRVHHFEKGDEGRLKLAKQLAERLEQKVFELGCPKGMPLGKEAELARAYGVSRWVMREAVAITERDGLTEMRRGPRGGLIVAATVEDALAAALCNFLLFTRVDVRELMEVRKTVDRSLYILAAQRLDDKDIDDASSLLELRSKGPPDEIALEIYDHVLRFSNNRFVSTFGLCLSKLSQCLGLLSEISPLEPEIAPIADHLLGIRRRQLECVIASDQYGVVEASAAAADAWIELFNQRPRPRAHSQAARASRAEAIARRISKVLSPGKTPRLSDIVATRLAMYILANRLEPGESIALEAELMEMFKVGRFALREAIRVLERDGFVQMEVGRAGGLKVGTPDAASLETRAANYLKFLGVGVAETDFLASEMLILATNIAAARLQSSADVDGIAVVETALRAFEAAQPREFEARLFDVGAALSNVTGNSILSLFFKIVSRVRANSPNVPNADRNAAAATASKMAAALRQGQVDLARRAMTQMVSYTLRPQF
jgi:DNA-binding FadR family transcriptional regulator